MVVGNDYVAGLPFMCVARSHVVQARMHIFKKLCLLRGRNSLNLELHRIQIGHRLRETHSLVTANRMTTNHGRTELATGEMSSAMQVKLLRVLQERKLRPVGATEETTVDTRVIAATNRDLAGMVKDGTFREDLYYRISVIPIELPALRERTEDIPELAQHFVEKFSAHVGRKLSITDSALRLLEQYLWPGNVRELEHAIERAVALETTEAIQPERLPEKITNYNPYRLAENFEFPEAGLNLTAHLDQLEKTYVMEALRRTAGNQTGASELLTMSVRSLRHLLDKHGIRSLTAQMRDERRSGETTPRRRSTDPTPRRRDEDESEFAASAGES